MGTSTARLLHAASERSGGVKALADRLGITESTLAYFMADATPLPDRLLLQVVDIVLSEQQSPLVMRPAGLLDVPLSPDNGFHEGGATSGAGAAE